MATGLPAARPVQQDALGFADEEERLRRDQGHARRQGGQNYLPHQPAITQLQTPLHQWLSEAEATPAEMGDARISTDAAGHVCVRAPAVSSRPTIARHQVGITLESTAKHLVSVVPFSSIGCGRVPAGSRTARTVAAGAAPLDEELAVLVEELPVHHPVTQLKTLA